MEKLKTFVSILSFSFIGACIYEVIVYLSNPFSPNWPELIREMLIVSLLVSGTIYIIQGFVTQSDDSAS